MRIERNEEGGARGVVLSRRNLLTLLAKLDGSPTDSACTIIAPPQYGEFFVKGEEDEPHYAHPSREEMRGVFGVMQPGTEHALAAR